MILVAASFCGTFRQSDYFERGKEGVTIWRGKSAVPTTGPDIHVKYKAFKGGPDYSPQVAEAIGLARIMLRGVLQTLQGGWAALTLDQLQVLDYYFVMAGPPSADDFKIIKESLILTSNGLSGAGLDIKVMAGIGSVNRHGGQTSSLKSFLGKKDRTQGVNVHTGIKGFRGDIHIGHARLDSGPELSAKTIIHEASHKFASG
jgi:hypothetical protein